MEVNANWEFTTTKYVLGDYTLTYEEEKRIAHFEDGDQVERIYGLYADCEEYRKEADEDCNDDYMEGLGYVLVFECVDDDGNFSEKIDKAKGCIDQAIGNFVRKNLV